MVARPSEGSPDIYWSSRRWTLPRHCLTSADCSTQLPWCRLNRHLLNRAVAGRWSVVLSDTSRYPTKRFCKYSWQAPGLCDFWLLQKSSLKNQFGFTNVFDGVWLFIFWTVSVNNVTCFIGVLHLSIHRVKPPTSHNQTSATCSTLLPKWGLNRHQQLSRWFSNQEKRDKRIINQWILSSYSSLVLL